jgi:outer membrane immunogenic protein
MPVKAAPIMAPAWTWSGFYAGAEGGWRDASGIVGVPPAGPYLPAITNQTGVIGGFIGAQKQFGQIVVGIEADYIGPSGNDTFGTVPSFSPFVLSQLAMRNVWTVGGRVGWAANLGSWNLMPYAAGGFAQAKWEERGVLAAAPATVVDTGVGAFSGWYVGGGLDVRVWEGLIVGVEYRHYEFQTKTLSEAAPGGGPVLESVTVKPKADTVMARVSFLFWPK